MTQEEWTKKFEEEGYSNINVVTLTPSDKPRKEHTHDSATTHVILKGELIITDPTGVKHYKEGERVNFPADTTHVATFGPQGCTMMIGFKDSA